MKRIAAEKKITLVTACVSLIFLIGTLTFLAPCGPKEDGTYMHCHLAGMSLTILAAVALAVSIVTLFATAKGWAYFASVLTAVCGLLSVLMPGTIIQLCMMPEMRCRALTQPGAAVFGVVWIILAVLSAFAVRRRGK